MESGTDQVKLSHALVHETRKADNDYLMDELKIVPDELDVVDKHVADYPMDEPKNELDKQVIKDHHVKETSVTSDNSLNCGANTVDNNADIPFKSKTLKKASITRTDDFLLLWEPPTLQNRQLPPCSKTGNIYKLQILAWP
jgi:hypothetical protein